MTGWRTTAPAGVPGRVPTDNAGAGPPDLRGSAFLAIGPSVARVAACKGVAERAGNRVGAPVMPVCASLPVGEGGAVWSSGICSAIGCQAAMTIGTVRVGARVGVQVAGTAIRRSSPGSGIGAGSGCTLRMAAGRDAAGAVGGCFVYRSGVRERMRQGLYQAVDMLRRIGKAGAECIDVGMAVNTLCRPGDAAMGSSYRRITVTLVAMDSLEGCIPSRRAYDVGIKIETGQGTAVAIGVGALQRCRGEYRRGPVGLAQYTAEHDGIRLGACGAHQGNVLGPQEVIKGAGAEAAVTFRAQRAGWDIQADMTEMCPVDVRVAVPAGGLGVT